MRQKKFWIPTSIVAFLVITVGMYYYYVSGPTDFLNDNQAIEALNQYNFNPKAIEIQDVVFLDEKHVFVPFITEAGYAKSYWKWKNRRWRLDGIDTSQLPSLWKTNPKDPSSYAFIWNISPDNDIAFIEFYLLGRRGYRISDYVHIYNPRVQLHFSVPIETKAPSYGVAPILYEWSAFLDSYQKVEKSKKPRQSFYNFMQPYSLEYAWISYNESGEVSFPKFAQGMGSGGANIVYLSSLNKQDLEYSGDKKLDSKTIRTALESAIKTSEYDEVIRLRIQRTLKELDIYAGEYMEQHGDDNYFVYGVVGLSEEDFKHLELLLMENQQGNIEYKAKIFSAEVTLEELEILSEKVSLEFFNNDGRHGIIYTGSKLDIAENKVILEVVELDDNKLENIRRVFDHHPALEVKVNP